MRISALHLLAYGHFTGRSLTFGAQPGLHVIYGDNEAGKSTALRALSSVLFGYPHEVIDGYRHDAKDIALGAELVGNDGQALSFLRKRRGKNALAKADGMPLEESAVVKMLGGASKDEFEKVFALDHHRLHEHASALLSEGGLLGFALAAARSGLSGLKATLDGLKAERAALFLPTGSRPLLNRQIVQLVDLRREARRRSVTLAEYKKRQKDIGEIEAALAEARTRDREIEADVRKLERTARNLPLRAQHSAALSKLELLALVPILPPDASAKRIKAEADRDAADTELTLANDAIAALNEELAKIELDQGILDKSAEVDALSAQRAVVENADKDLPRRDAERAQHYIRVGDLLSQAELAGSATGLAALLPSAVRRKQVSILADKGRALTTQDETLTEAAATAEQEVRLANERLASTEAPTDMATLNAALVAADSLGDIRADIVKRMRILGTKAKTTHDSIVGLGLELGDASLLRKFSVPSDETVARLRQAFATADADRTAHAADLTRLVDDLQSLKSRVENLALGGAVASKEDLEASRVVRDEAWAIVRGVYIDKRGDLEGRATALAKDGDLAGVFERRKGFADSTADGIIAHTKEAAELSLSTHQRGQIETKIAAADAKLEAMKIHRRGLETEWVASWPSTTISIQSPAEMGEWLKRREALLREDTEQQTELDAIAELEAKETQACIVLRGALTERTAIEENSTLNTLRTKARTFITAATSAATQHAKAVEALESGQQRKRKADAARERVKTQTVEWSTNWQAALREAGLKDTLSIDAAVTILDIMTVLDGLKLQIDDLSHRIETMTEDKADFEAAIVALGPLVTGNEGVGATEISRQLETRLEIAKATQNTHHGLREQHKIRTEAQRQASGRLSRGNAALIALCEAAGCDDQSTLAEIERTSVSKQEALREREQLEKRVLEDGAGLTLDALFAECEGMAGDTLPGRIAALRVEREELQTMIDKLMTERATLRAAFDALFGQDQAAETLQDAANVEADIAVMTQSYVDLTLQEIALRQAIDLYRDRNQGPILGRAKLLFAQLTDGAYSGLRADVDENDDAILIAEHATRGSLEVTALSDGTVDPLYLALRLAVVQEHNATSEPLPFIADDLLLNLDNKRAESTLRTLGMLAETGQVLFFTHHEHMVALARACLPTDILTEHRL